jgi:hypothetical protein
VFRPASGYQGPDTPAWTLDIWYVHRIGVHIDDVTAPVYDD